jgi:hypothetical protein
MRIAATLATAAWFGSQVLAQNPQVNLYVICTINGYDDLANRLMT